MKSRRRFFKAFAAAMAVAACSLSLRAALDKIGQSTEKKFANLPSMVDADGHLRFEFGDERMVCDQGLQPFLFTTKTGALVVQVQSPKPPLPTARMHYPYALITMVSRDGGNRWTEFPVPAGDNGLNAEGGMIQLRDGTILCLDTYVTPGREAGQGLGQLYVSQDDWTTLNGPQEVGFNLPHVNFYASSDDGGRPHAAERLHRRMLELPNGDLLASMYGQLEGDKTPSNYAPTMIKARVMIVKSTDRGRSWKMISTIAQSPPPGTEGLGEPVIARVSGAGHPGRLLCLARTGRELYEATSDDDGVTWSAARPRVFAGLDVNRTELWVDMFRGVKGRSGRYLDENNLDELRGAVVDPDLITLRSGLLVAAFGIRIPQKACWPHCEHPWNGNYLAVSTDGGETWGNVVRMTSGIMTTHYMGVVETLRDNELFVVYDHGYWGKPDRFTYGRPVKISVGSR